MLFIEGCCFNQREKDFTVTLGLNVMIFAGWNLTDIILMGVFYYYHLVWDFSLKGACAEFFDLCILKEFKSNLFLSQTIFYDDGHSRAITVSLKPTSVEVSLSQFPYRTINFIGRLTHLSCNLRNSAQLWNLGQCI